MEFAMQAKILIVEDEILVALDMEMALEEMGHKPVGIAPDSRIAATLAHERPDIALVDLNLRDGLTGPQIARRLVDEHGVGIIFVTANPRMIGDNHAGIIGVVEKPCDHNLIRDAIHYAMLKRKGETAAPPSRMVVFG